MSFEPHINATTCKALKILGFVIRNTKIFSSASSLRSLYFALVRSVLEYGGIVWYPYLAKDQLRIERVQNKFLSYISYILKIQHPQHDYSLIRKSLNIPTLFSRRIEADRCFITSLLNGTLDVPDFHSKISFCVPTHHTRDHSLFHIPSHSTSYGNNHSFHRMLRLANSHLF